MASNIAVTLICPFSLTFYVKEVGTKNLYQFFRNCLEVLKTSREK